MRHETMRTKIAAALGGVAVALLRMAGSAAAHDAAQLLDRGKRAFEAGDYAAARTDLWAYLEATAGLSGPSRLPQADALYTIALMEADAGLAAQHYRTIVEEYAASSVADEALFRLIQLDVVEGRAEDAREKLQRLSVDYPFSRYQAEVPLWTGKAWLAEGQHRRATDAFIEGFTRVKRQDLPQELSAAQREALGAEYVYQLARAFGEEGDSRTSTQYYAMLALDYPDSPQAAEARIALGEEPGAIQVAAAPAEEEPREDAVVEEPVGEEAPVGSAEGEPVYVPERMEPPADEPAQEVPDIVIEDAGPRDEPVREEPPPVIIEDARPREQPAAASGSAWLQIGAFTSATNAADLSRRLKADGFDAQVEIGVVDGQGYYRVRVGPYLLPSDTSRLEETRSRLASRGYPARQVSE
ncbi:hypothetical protein BH20GEM1_BH20GEM1_10430 [soil metagenome]